MTALPILAVTHNSVRVDVDGTAHTASRRAVDVALAYMTESCNVSHRLGTRGPRLPIGQWQAMADAMRNAELGGAS